MNTKTKKISFILLIKLIGLSFSQNLYISEYFEGNGGNVKYIELYNNSDKNINLADSNYYLLRFSNSNLTNTRINLSGTITSKSFFVIGNSGTIISNGGVFHDSVLTQTTNSINHNGNDKYQLVKDGIVVDAFASDNIGNDTSFAENVVAYRIAKELPNNGNWGNNKKPNDSTNSSSNFWKIYHINTNNSNATTIGSPIYEGDNEVIKNTLSKGKNFSVYQENDKISIFSNISGIENITIFSLDGVIHFKNDVSFINGKAQIELNLVKNILYIIRLKNIGIKFITK